MFKVTYYLLLCIILLPLNSVTQNQAQKRSASPLIKPSLVLSLGVGVYGLGGTVEARKLDYCRPLIPKQKKEQQHES